MAAFADREAATGVSDIYQFVVGDSAFHFTVDDGRIELRDGWASEPDVVVTTDEETWANIASGKITASAAAATGAMTTGGDPQPARRLERIFSRDRVLAQAEVAVTGSKHTIG